MIDPKDGIKTRFSSTNQPDPAKKRVPKYKTRLRKFFLEEGIDKLIQIARGDDNRSVLKALEDIKEWVYGKEKDIIDLNTNYSPETIEAIKKVIEKDKK